MNKMTKVLIGVGVCLSYAVAVERVISKYKSTKIRSKFNDRLNDIAEDNKSAEQISSMIGDIDIDKLNDVYVPSDDECTEYDDDDINSMTYMYHHLMDIQKNECDDDDIEDDDIEDEYVRYIKNVEKNINNSNDNDDTEDTSYEELKTIAEELKSFAEDNPIDIKESHYTEEPSNSEPIFRQFEADKTVDIPWFLEYVFELSLNKVNPKVFAKVRFDKYNKGYAYEHPNAPGYYIYYIGNTIYMYENNDKNTLTYNKHTKEWYLDVTYHSAKIVLDDVIHNENIDDENDTYWSFSNQVIISDNISIDEDTNLEMQNVVVNHVKSLMLFLNVHLQNYIYMKEFYPSNDNSKTPDNEGPSSSENIDSETPDKTSDNNPRFTVDIPAFLDHIMDKSLKHVNPKAKAKVRFDKDNKGYVYEHPTASGYYIYHIDNIIYMYADTCMNTLTFNKRTKEWDLNVTYHSAKIILNNNGSVIFDGEIVADYSISHQIIVSDRLDSDEEINKELKEVVKHHAESLIEFFNKSLYNLFETF